MANTKFSSIDVNPNADMMAVLYRLSTRHLKRFLGWKGVTIDLGARPTVSPRTMTPVQQVRHEYPFAPQERTTPGICIR